MSVRVPPPSRHVMSHINLHCPRCIRFTTVAHHSVPCWACRSLFIPVSPYQTRQFLGFGPLFQVGPFPSSSSSSYQGCGVGVETGVGVDRRRRFWPESESELDSVNFATPTPARRCRMPTSTDDNYGRTGMHRLENIVGQAERRVAVRG